MPKPYIGLSVFPHLNFFQTCIPLLELGLVEIIEWSFDQVRIQDRPVWLNLLLSEYSQADRLIAHGVHYSAFNGKLNHYHQEWLSLWKAEQLHLKFNHISEHIGFKSELSFDSGFPLPFDFDQVDPHVFSSTLSALKNESDCRIGFENLALAFSKSQVLSQAKFLKQLCDELDSFIVMDLHNLYCQSLNYGIDIDELISLYPIEYIEEIHISGGSDVPSDYDLKQIRRDTHNDRVPEILFDTLLKWLPKFVACKYIILEQLPESLVDLDAIDGFQRDFNRLISIRDEYKPSSPSKEIDVPEKNNLLVSNLCFDRDVFFNEQNKMSKSLAQIKFPDEIRRDHYKYFKCHEWSLSMVETAMILSKKWNKNE